MNSKFFKRIGVFIGWTEIILGSVVIGYFLIHPANLLDGFGVGVFCLASAVSLFVAGILFLKNQIIAGVILSFITAWPFIDLYIVKKISWERFEKGLEASAGNTELRIKKAFDRFPIIDSLQVQCRYWKCEVIMDTSLDVILDDRQSKKILDRVVKVKRQVDKGEVMGFDYIIALQAKDNGTCSHSRKWAVRKTTLGAKPLPGLKPGKVSWYLQQTGDLLKENWGLHRCADKQNHDNLLETGDSLEDVESKTMRVASSAERFFFSGVDDENFIGEGFLLTSPAGEEIFVYSLPNDDSLDVERIYNKCINAAFNNMEIGYLKGRSRSIYLMRKGNIVTSRDSFFSYSWYAKEAAKEGFSKEIEMVRFSSLKFDEDGEF